MVHGPHHTLTKSEKKTATDPFELAGRLRLSVTRLARILRHQDAGTLAPTLSAALATVDREGPLTLGELALREHVAPPSMSKAVDKLVGMGFVERRADATDRRVAQVHITPAGHRHVMKNRSRRTAWLATRAPGALRRRGRAPRGRGRGAGTAGRTVPPAIDRP